MTDLLADAVAELYEADPDRFTERRQELVTSAREAAQAAVAKQIAGLRKPTRSAWVVNRLVRADPQVASRLAALAAELRAEPSMDGARIRELTAARGRLVDELTRQALQVSDLPAPPAALREEVTATLDAAIADPEGAANLGTLVRAAHWAGFGLAPVAALPDAAASPPPPSSTHAQTSPPAHRAPATSSATATARTPKTEKPPPPAPPDAAASPPPPSSTHAQTSPPAHRAPATSSATATARTPKTEKPPPPAPAEAAAEQDQPLASRV